MSMYVDAVPVLYIADWLVQQSHTPRRQLWACGEQVCGCAEKKKIHHGWCWDISSLIRGMAIE
jgi:hypothetical protein